MTQLGEVNEVEVIQTDGTVKKIRLVTIGVKRETPAAPAPAEPPADPIDPADAPA